MNKRTKNLYLRGGGAVVALSPLMAFAHDGALHEASAKAASGGWLSAGFSLWQMIAALSVIAAAYVLWRYASRERGVRFATVGSAGTLLLAIIFLSADGSTPSPGAAPFADLEGIEMTVYKSPTCGCCGGYVAALRRAGVEVVVEETEELMELKEAHGVAPHLSSCHTTLADGYVIEGHVPLAAVEALLKEKPDIAGIALPGMPAGTPGMPGMKRGPYDVLTLSGDAFMTL